MKKVVILFSAYIVLAFTLISQTNCLLPEFEDKCSGVISSIVDDYIYLKSRPFNSDISTDVLFEVPLKRNILYVFSVCEYGGKNKMIINLYDSKDKLVASNLDAATQNVKTALTFKAQEAGKYYVSASFSKKEKSCCLILFGLIREHATAK